MTRQLCRFVEVEIIMTNLSLGLVGLEGGGDPLGHGGGPGVGLLLLDPQEGVGVEVPH